MRRVKHSKASVEHFHVLLDVSNGYIVLHCQRWTVGLVVLLTGSLGEMKWECLAIILESPLKEEWVSIFRILFEIPLKAILMSLIRCNAHQSLASRCNLSLFVFFC